MKISLKNAKNKVGRWINRTYDQKLPQIRSFLMVVFVSFSVFMGFALYATNEKLKHEDWANLPKPKEIIINPKVAAMVQGTPMEAMVPYISERDEQVASYLVAIAKKESNWGKFSPKKDGQECYNYWGYRGQYNKTASGYSCFRSPKHAIETVGDRLAELIDQKIDTPSEMVVWKCGRDCVAAGGQAAADKWVRDVDFYYRKLYD